MEQTGILSMIQMLTKRSFSYFSNSIKQECEKYNSVKCNSQEIYRRADGSCNNRVQFVFLINYKWMKSHFLGGTSIGKVKDTS